MDKKDKIIYNLSPHTYHLITYLVDHNGVGLNRNFLLFENFAEELLKDTDPISWLIEKRKTIKHIYIINIIHLKEDQYYDLKEHK